MKKKPLEKKNDHFNEDLKNLEKNSNKKTRASAHTFTLPNTLDSNKNEEAFDSKIGNILYDL